MYRRQSGLNPYISGKPKNTVGDSIPVKNQYVVLEVERTATPRDIKVAYRRLARRHHPDVNGGSKAAEARFKEVGKAYDILSDPEKRREHDAELGLLRRDTGPSSSSATSFDGDLFSIFNAVFGNRGSSTFGQTRTASATARRPLNMIIENARLNMTQGYTETARDLVAEAVKRLRVVRPEKASELYEEFTGHLVRQAELNMAQGYTKKASTLVNEAMERLNGSARTEDARKIYEAFTDHLVRQTEISMDQGYTAKARGYMEPALRRLIRSNREREARELDDAFTGHLIRQAELNMAHGYTDRARPYVIEARDRLNEEGRKEIGQELVDRYNALVQRT